MSQSINRSTGFWVLFFFAILILLMLVSGQLMSIVNYDFAVAYSLQESVDVVGEMGVAFNKAFGVGDTVIYLPLLLLGLIGLWRQKKWGVLAMLGALSITAYWPIVNIFFLFFASGLPGFHFTDYASYTIILSLISIYGLWGIWYLYHNNNWIVLK